MREKNSCTSGSTRGGRSAASSRRRVLILVSKFDHCLSDLLYRQRIGELAMDVVAIVGNHPAHALAAVLPDDVPYHHLPITPETKPQQEAALRGLIAIDTHYERPVR